MYCIATVGKNIFSRTFNAVKSVIHGKENTDFFVIGNEKQSFQGTSLSNILSDDSWDPINKKICFQSNNYQIGINQQRNWIWKCFSYSRRNKIYIKLNIISLS